MATTALQALDNTLCTYQNNPKDIVELELKCKNNDKCEEEKNRENKNDRANNDMFYRRIHRSAFS